MISYPSLPYIMYTLSAVLGSGQIIVGKGWFPPRWFLGSSGPPPGDDFVVADTIQVTADGDTVIAPS